MPKAYNPLDMTSTKIVNLADPTAAQDAVTKAYLETRVPGATAAFVQGGNSFGATATLGTNDNNPLHIEVNNTTIVTLTPENVGLGSPPLHAVTGSSSVSGHLTVTGSITGSTGGSLTLTDAVTNTTTNVLEVTHNSTGTPAASFGTGIQLMGETTTTPGQPMARITSFWTTATNASRSADLVFELTRSAAALAERLRISASGALTVTAASTAITPLHLKGGGTGHSVPWFKITDNSSNNIWAVDSNLYWHRYGDPLVLEMTGDDEGGVRMTLRNDTSDQGARFDAFPTTNDGTRDYVDFVFGYWTGDAKLRLEGRSTDTQAGGDQEWQFSAFGGSPTVVGLSDVGVWIGASVDDPPATPASGFTIWVDPSSGDLKAISSNGTVTTLALY